MSICTCEWCGKKFNSDSLSGVIYENTRFCSKSCEQSGGGKQRTLKNEFLDGTDLGGLVKTVGGVGKLFGGKKAKAGNQQPTSDEIAAKTERTKVNAEIAGNVVKGFLDLYVAPIKFGIKKIEESNKKKEQKAEVAEVALDELANFSFSEESNELQTQIQNLLSKAAGLKTGPFASANDKKTMAVIKEKMEFGIMKLRSAGNTAEADFFQGKLSGLK